jgi:HK97 family phage major capsid protein
MLDDVAGLSAYLGARLPSKIRVKEDNVLLYGSNSPALTGITEAASSYTDALADSNVNRFDVLTSAIAQVRDGEYMANAIMVHPDDFYNLLLIKDTNGLYLMPDAFRFGAQAPRIAGVPLIANTAITTGDFLVGDFAMGAQLFDRQQSSIRFYEQDQDNAIKGVITVVASERIALPIYRPSAFIYGTFAAALANGSA